jgi:diguanylate cyclase (GGDEF)-like protein
VRISGTTQDITERKKSEEKIRFLAYYDDLTLLPNRTLFMDRLNVSLEVARRQKKKVALIFLDLDRFKRINDTLGHAWGDEILRQTAVRLNRCIRSCDAIVRGNPQADIDTVARLAGDEFVLSVGEISRAEDVSIVARRVQRAFTEPYVVEGREIVISGSMGISIYPDDGSTAEMVLKNAEIALHHAKSSGWAAYRFFRESMNVAAMQRLNMEGHLSKALSRGEFVLHYQPLVDIQSGKVIGAEALLRWNQPDLGPVDPATFIPIAEETGMIVPIGEWVLHAACAQAKSWERAGNGLPRILVNISARQFRDRRFFESIPQILKETGLSAGRLEIEITESCLMEDTSNSSRLLSELRETGVRVSIDDFGTGYSSLSYLTRLPVDTLKIDRSFVQGLLRSPSDVAVTQAIITMAGGMNLAVIAEGIEQMRQLTILRSQGCRLAQGFLLGGAMPAEDFARRLEGSIDVGAGETGLAAT